MHRASWCWLPNPDAPTRAVLAPDPHLGAGCRQGEVMVPPPSAGFGSVVTLEPAAGELGVGKPDLQGSPPPQLC